MTIVDDFQALYKLRGVRIVSELLGKAPTDLLRRTGVDGLLFAVSNDVWSVAMKLIGVHQSLSTAMTALRDPNTPELLKISIQTTLALVEKMTGKNSVERFDRLCQLVGEDIIGKIFTYVQAGGDAIADRSLDATVEVLPETIVSLGIGSARYLKVSYKNYYVFKMTTGLVFRLSYHIFSQYSLRLLHRRTRNKFHAKHWIRLSRSAHRVCQGGKVFLQMAWPKPGLSAQVRTVFTCKRSF